jgi:hypothetical protein
MANYFYELNQTYTQWKAARTALAGTTYVVTTPMNYIGVLVQTAEKTIHTVRVIRRTDDPNLSDFETNILPTATAAVSINDAVSAEIA